MTRQTAPVAQATAGAPGGRPAPGSGRKRVWRRIGNGLIAVVIGAGAVYAQNHVMNKDELDAPLTAHAAPGQAATTGRFTVRLESVETARSLRLVTTGTDFSTRRETVKSTKTVPTRQIFVIANVTATAPTEPTQLKLASLLTRDGRTYQATDKVDPRFTLANGWVQPGWWARGSYVFEVPPSALPGASVVIGVPSGNGLYDEIYPGRFDQLLPEVALDVASDDAAAKRLADQPKSVYELKARG